MILIYFQALSRYIQLDTLFSEVGLSRHEVQILMFSIANAFCEYWLPDLDDVQLCQAWKSGLTEPA